MKTHNPTHKFQGDRRTPLDSIKSRCRWCNGGSHTACTVSTCPLHAFHADSVSPGDKTSPLQAIRACCLDCAGTPEGVRACAAYKAFGGQPPCELWPHREGKRAVSPEYREERREQALKQHREPGPKATFSRLSLFDYAGKG